MGSSKTRPIVCLQQYGSWCSGAACRLRCTSGQYGSSQTTHSSLATHTRDVIFATTGNGNKNVITLAIQEQCEGSHQISACIGPEWCNASLFRHKSPFTMVASEVIKFGIIVKVVLVSCDAKVQLKTLNHHAEPGMDDNKMDI